MANPTGTGWVTGRGIFSSFLGGNWLVNATLEAAKNNGQARILAEPNLTTLSGQEANFLAGGQIPYPTPSALGATPGVDYKDYGVKLQFVPVVLDSGVISLKLYVSVSDLDYANGIQLVGASTITPALKTRLANSTVEIQSGQTISIAGILDERLADTIDKFPALGDIPILGMMFRSQAYRKKQTELVIFVTPRLARSFDPQKIKTPLAADSFVAPSDMEFYLLGRNRPSKPQQNAPATPSGKAAPTGTLGPDQAGSEGHFGHDL